MAGVKRLFWACAGLSLGLHGALAIAWQPRAAAAATAPDKRPTPPLHSRLIVRPPGLPPAARAVTATVTATVTAATSTATATATAPQRGQPGLQPPRNPAAATDPPPVDQPPTAIEPDPAAEAVAAAEAAVEIQAGSRSEAEAAANAGDWDHYYARSQLSVVPSPREHILLGYPDDGPAIGRFVLTLALYIDETGAVRRVDVASDEALPDALREAARLAFTGQRFSPGEREGAVVKSRIRIEVLYESLALPAFAANTAAPEGVTAQ